MTLTSAQKAAIEEERRCTGVDISRLSPDDREWYIDRRELYNIPFDHVPYEWRDYYREQKALLDAQDPYRVRYAFCQEIPVQDLPAAEENYRNLTIACWVRTAGEVIGHAGMERENSIATIRKYIDISYAEAWDWLYRLVCLILYRYGWTFICTYADGTAYLPDYNYWLEVWGSGYNGVPAKFATMLLKEKDESWDELMDRVDLVVFEATSNLMIDDWIRIQYEEYEKRKKKLSMFRTALIAVMVAVVVLPTVYTAFRSALSVLSHVQGWNISIFAKLKLSLTAFMDVMGAGFSAFLTAIHYSTLLGIHKIAFLVSPAYREIMRQVYGELGRVSDALGYGPYTLLLLMQNSRNLVLDVSTTLGMEYDLAEVQWLSSFQEYLKSFSGAAYKYRDNPEALLYDLTRWIEKDALNAKGSYMGSLTRTVDGLVRNIESFVGDVTKIRDDIDKLVSDLPENIRSEIEPAIEPYIRRFDDFITETYDPYRHEIDSILSTMRTHQDELNNRTDEIVDRLKKPADYLLEIDLMSEEDRLDQERKAGELSNREYYRQVDAFVPLSEPVSAELEKIREALEVAVPVPIGFPEEVEGPQRPKGVKAAVRKTWYVGDF